MAITQEELVAVKIRSAGKAIEGLSHQCEFGQFLAAEISCVVAELLQQPWRSSSGRLLVTPWRFLMSWELFMN